MPRATAFLSILPLLCAACGCGAGADSSDAGARDAAGRDVGAADAGASDGGATDGSLPDAAPADAGTDACTPVEGGCVYPTWTEVGSTPSPSARMGHGMAYDSARERVVLFGGFDGSDPLADTWEYDGSSWSEITPEGSPPARSEHAMVFDSARERVVLFGGFDGSDPLGDTWDYDGSSWSEITPEGSPPARSEHAMVYDAARGRVVMTGGFPAETTPEQRTWEHDGVRWMAGPSATELNRRGHAMAYDAVRSRVVLFGYRYRCCVGRDLSTLEYDGVSWSHAAWGPPDQLSGYATMVFDAARGRIVLAGFASRGPFGPDAFETWDYVAGRWLETTSDPSPPGRDAHAMAYDSKRGVTVLFGGVEVDGSRDVLSDTWELGLHGGSAGGL